MKIRSLILIALLLACAGLQAQTFPTKPITFVVPASAGGAVDILARALAQQMGQQMGQTMQKQTDQLTRQIGTLFEQQPLIAGALAFAAGAALGAALPHTREEDKLVGEAADNIRREAGKTAAELYEQGKEKVGEVYEEATDKAGKLYGDVKEKVAELGSQPGNGQSGYSSESGQSTYRH